MEVTAPSPFRSTPASSEVVTPSPSESSLATVSSRVLNCETGCLSEVSPSPLRSMPGLRNIRGMHHSRCNTATRANLSEALDSARLQWFLVHLRATATSGAEPAVVSRKANMAA